MTASGMSPWGVFGRADRQRVAPMLMSLVAIAAGLAGCASTTSQLETPAGSTQLSDSFAPPNNPADPVWRPVNIRFKTPTDYRASVVDGAACIHAEANGAWSLRVATVPPAQSNGNMLSWRWHVPALIPDADNMVIGKDDAPARIVVAFKGDRSKLDAAERATMSLAKAMGGNELPFAAIQYIWEAKAPVESIANNSNTTRIKKLIVKTGTDGLNAWAAFTRDVRADFRRAFPGEEPGDIESVGLMTDSDSLGVRTEACYADVVLR